jgi:nitrate ABC transporter ATP-binding subunit
MISETARRPGEWNQPETAPGLSLRGVGKEFLTAQGRNAVLRQVDLDIRHGEFVTLIGHSGCGKSTLVNIIAGLESATTGEVLLDGRPVTGPGPDRGVVFQQYSLLPWMSVFRNVYAAVDSVFKDRTKAEKRERAEEILRRVGLSEHRDKRPAQLSGGMKQRVAIARAFAVHPKVLLLDEPFGALDALTRNFLQEELLALWTGDRQTETVVMVTHDIDEAIYLSDRIVVIANGPGPSIREILTVPLGRPRDKRTSLQSPAWIELKERLYSLLMSPAERATVARFPAG